MELARRSLLGGAAAAAAGVALSATGARASPGPAVAFAHGVASGDPLADRVVLWTRLTAARDLPVRWTVARDPALTSVVRSGSAVATADRDRTVKVDVDGLSPYTTYWYAFECAGVRSPVGRTRTAPATGQDVGRLRFAVVTCSKYDNGYFNAYARVAEADVDAVLHCGDYIYEGRTDSEAPPGRETFPPTEVRTLAEYRQRYAHYRTDPDLQRLHATHPMVSTWDDHESANDSWVGGASAHDPDTEGDWFARKAAAQRVYDEWMPLRLPVPGDPSRIYRRLGYGDLVDLVVLDTRLEGRSRQLQGLDGDEVVTDPAVADPARQLYSPVQRAWVEDSLAGSSAAWKLVVNQVLVSQLRAVGLPRAASDVLSRLGSSMVPSEGVALAADIWDGYSAERDRLLGFLRAQQVQDVVVLTGDIHASLANDLTEDPYDPLLPPAAVEFVTPSVTSSNVDEGLGVPPRTASLAIEQALRVQNPATKYVELDSNGYVLLDVTAERVQAEWWFVDTVREPSSGQRLDATWQVLRGAQRLSPGGPATSGRDQAGAPAAAPPASRPAPPAPAGATLASTGSGPIAAAALGALAAAAVVRRRVTRP
ncbi:MAG TPA: alkaline phosphatase D family protein [Mycobacteriales bacterium]|nr:alkaline phosphatase D family protein [Mycobacteriales bacterium]